MPRFTNRGCPQGDAGTRPVRVLIVDDSRSVLKTIRELLGSDGRFLVVGEAREGLEALDLVESCHPDVVLLEVRLPGLNGFETTIQIKSKPAPPAVVIMTAQTGLAYRTAAESAGADGFLEKGNLAGELPGLLWTLGRREEG